MSQVSKHSFTPNVEAFSGTNTGMGVRACTVPAVLGMKNSKPSIIDVDV